MDHPTVDQLDSSFISLSAIAKDYPLFEWCVWLVFLGLLMRISENEFMEIYRMRVEVEDEFVLMRKLTFFFW